MRQIWNSHPYYEIQNTIVCRRISMMMSFIIITRNPSNTFIYYHLHYSYFVRSWIIYLFVASVHIYRNSSKIVFLRIGLLNFKYDITYLARARYFIMTFIYAYGRLQILIISFLFEIRLLFNTKVYTLLRII